MRKILSLLGLKVVLDVAELTFEFIRTTLLNLHLKLNRFVQSVLNDALVDGKAI